MMPSVQQLPFATQRTLIFAAVSGAAVLDALYLPATPWTLGLAIAAILIAIAHGSFDGALAEEVLRPRLGVRWQMPFYLAYLALGAAVLGLWWIAPSFALVAFLLYSAYHFGTEALSTRSDAAVLTGAAAGLVPIAAACHWWPIAVEAIFAVMLRGSAEHAGTIIMLGSHALWPAAVIAALGGLLLDHRAGWLACVLIVTELLLFRFCSPVAAFAVFFCVWHTPDHLLSTSLDIQGRFTAALLRRHLRQGLPFWFIAVAGTGVVCWLGRHDLRQYTGAVFIALSALTVPHMALAELCQRHGTVAFSRLAKASTLKGAAQP